LARDEERQHTGVQDLSRPSEAADARAESALVTLVWRNRLLVWRNRFAVWRNRFPDLAEPFGRSLDGERGRNLLRPSSSAQTGSFVFGVLRPFGLLNGQPTPPQPRSALSQGARSTKERSARNAGWPYSATYIDLRTGTTDAVSCPIQSIPADAAGDLDRR
jgi:hypothetical protein